MVRSSAFRPCMAQFHSRHLVIKAAVPRYSHGVFSVGRGRAMLIRFKEGAAPESPKSDNTQKPVRNVGMESDSMPISSSAGFSTHPKTAEVPNYPDQSLPTPEQAFASADVSPTSETPTTETGLQGSPVNPADISSGLPETSSSPAAALPISGAASTSEDLGPFSTGELPEMGSMSGAAAAGQPVDTPQTSVRHPASGAALQAALNASGAPDLDEKLAGQLHVAPSGPYEDQPFRGVPVNPAAGFGFTALAAGWLAVAMPAIFSPAAVTGFLFPSAKGQLGGFACVMMWGASLVPVAAAVLSLQDAVNSSMVGTAGSNYLTAAVFAASVATLVVTLQAVSLRHPMLLGVVGTLSFMGTALTAWITAKAHPWGVPLPNIRGILTSLLACITPRTWQAAVFTIIGLSLAGLSTQLVKVTPDSINILLGGSLVPGPGPHLAQSLAVFTARSAAGAVVCASVICLVLKETADRHLLATSFARRLSNSIAMASTITSLTLLAALLVGVTAPNFWVIITLLGQLGVAAWAITTSMKPAEILAQALPLPASGLPGLSSGAAGSAGGHAIRGPPPVVSDTATGRHLYDNAMVLRELAKEGDPGF